MMTASNHEVAHPGSREELEISITQILKKPEDEKPQEDIRDQIKVLMANIDRI